MMNCKKSVKSILAILILNSVISITVAEEVIVTVKEKGTGDLVENATVVLIQKTNYLDPIGEDENLPYRETDEKGQAVFSNQKKPRALRILAPGYETYLRSNNKNTHEITVYLDTIEIESDGLEVIAERIPEVISKIQLSSTELTKAAGSQGDPIKALSSLPGIVNAGEDSADVYMRGSDTDENITRVNHAPIGYLYHFGDFQSTIHPKIISDINLFLGGFPIEYGNSMGGVIDVKLRTPRTDRNHYFFDISTITSSFMVEGPAGNDGKDSFFIAGRRSYIDAILSPDDFSDLAEDEEDDDPDKFTLVPRFFDFQALHHHVLENGYLDSYIFAASDAIALDIRDSAKSDPQLAGELRDKTSFQTAGFTWNQSLNSRWSHIMSLAYYNFESKTRLGRDENGESFYADVKNDSLYFNPEWRLRINGKDNLSFGTILTHSKSPVNLYLPPATDDPDFDFTSSKKYRLERTLKGNLGNAYIKYRKQLTPKLSSTIGINYNYLKFTGGYQENKFSPRGSLEYQLTDDTLLFGSWGQYLQTPGASQIVEVYGNPGLKVEKSEHRILGVHHRFSDLYSLKTEVYHKPMDDLVVSIDENDPPDNFANRGTGDAYGIDIFFKREARNRKIGWVSLSLAKSERTNEITNVTRDFDGDQPVTLTAVWGQPFGGSWKKWNWSVKTQVHSGTPYTKIIGRHREDPNDPSSRWRADYGKHNAARTPTYFKMDLRIGKEVKYDESILNFYFDIQNVTFHDNIVEYDYGNEYEKIDNPTEISGMSFFPYFGVEIEF